MSELIKANRFGSISARRAMVIGGAALVLLIAAYFTYLRPTLSGSSQRFGLIVMQSSQPNPVSPNSSQGLAAPVAIEQEASAISSLAEAQQQVPFVIPQPTWLPDQLELLGARVGSGPSGDDNPAPVQVMLLYGHPDPDGNPQYLISLDIFSQPSIQGGVGVPDFAIKDVSVNGQPAVFAQGAYDKAGTWDLSAGYALLSWADAHYTYVLSASGYPSSINEDDLIRTASSIK